jgi:hypothetical protein
MRSFKLQNPNFREASRCKAASERGGPSVWDDQDAGSVRADDLSAVQARFDLLMLMTVQQKLRLCASDVRIERGKTEVDFVITIVNEPRRVVGNKNIYRWEFLELVFHLVLLKEIIASRLVFPRPTEAPELHSTEGKCGEVQVFYGDAERGARVVVAFYREDFMTTVRLRGPDNHFVRYVSARDEQVCSTLGQARDYEVVVGNHERGHPCMVVPGQVGGEA